MDRQRTGRPTESRRVSFPTSGHPLPVALLRDSGIARASLPSPAVGPGALPLAARPRTAPLPMRHRLVAALSATALFAFSGSAAPQDQAQGARFPVSTALAEGLSPEGLESLDALVARKVVAQVLCVSSVVQKIIDKSN